MNKDGEKQKTYEPPRILASYTREELAETIRPHGAAASYDGQGCGCSCGCGCS